MGIVAFATDGLLAVADGRRAILTSRPGVYEWERDDERKIFAVPALPAVALTSGRASLGGASVCEILQSHIAKDAEGLPGSVREVGDLAHRALSVAAAESPSSRGIHLLIAGFGSSKSREVYRLEVPPSFESEQGHLAIDSLLHRVSVREAFPVLFNPALTESALEFSSELDMYFDLSEQERWEQTDLEPIYRYSNLGLDELLPKLKSLLSGWVDRKLEILEADAVGGYWTFASAWADGRFSAEVVPLGPFGCISG